MVLLLVMAACQPPDAPRSLSRRLPTGVLEMLHPDTVRTVRVGAGVTYRYLWSAVGPWAVHIVEAELGARCDLSLDVLRAEERESGRGGREHVSGMVARDPGAVLAAVNADFFTPEGTTVGPEVVDGRITSSRRRPALAWKPGAAPWMGMPTSAPSALDVGWLVPRGEGDGRTEVVGGFPELLAEGARVGDLGVQERPGFSATRHPRTAVGFAPESGRFWIVVVDGRQPPHSSGMTLPELAQLFEGLGAEEALNLDGGGSSVMLVGRVRVSSPSDATGERPVVNALALTRDYAGCAINDPR